MQQQFSSQINAWLTLYAVLALESHWNPGNVGSVKGWEHDCASQMVSIRRNFQRYNISIHIIVQSNTKNI